LNIRRRASKPRQGETSIEENAMSTSDSSIFKSMLKHANVRELNPKQRELVDAYRLGKLDETDFQFRLSKDPALAKWVREVLEAASTDSLSRETHRT